MNTAVVVSKDIDIMHGSRGKPDESDTTALAVLDNAQTALAQITTLDEAKKCRDEIATLQHYLKRRGAGIAKQNRAARFKFRVERRAGEFLLAVPREQGKRDGEGGLLLELKRSGIKPHEAYRWMALARIPEAELLALADACDSSGDELTATLVYDGLVRQYYGRGGKRPPDADWRSIPPYIIKQQLIEWGVLDAADLAGLPPGGEESVVTEVRSFYEDYCEDPARGKVWQEGVWNPPSFCDRRMVQTLTRRVVAGIRAGRIDTSERVRRGLYVPGVYDDPQQPAPQRANKKWSAPRVFTTQPSSCVGRWAVAAGRLMLATERLLDDPASAKESLIVPQVLRQMRDALDEVQRVIDAVPDTPNVATSVRP